MTRYHGSFNDVLQLSNIARIVGASEHSTGLWTEIGDFFHKFLSKANYRAMTDLHEIQRVELLLAQGDRLDTFVGRETKKNQRGQGDDRNEQHLPSDWKIVEQTSQMFPLKLSIMWRAS